MPGLQKNNVLNTHTTRMTKAGLAALGFLVLFSACTEDENAGKPLHDTLHLELSGLKDAGPDHVYEGWLLINGEHKSIGTFTVNAAGVPSKQDFYFNREQLADASGFAVTLEPAQDTNPAPGALKVLSGSFQGANAQLTVSQAVTGNDALSAIDASFLLASPSTPATTDELRGLWFAKRNAVGHYTAGLAQLPQLATGWQYEGWVVINGQPYSTGKFSNASGQDQSNQYGGGQGGMQFPGEDFITGAPAGVSFPESLAGNPVLISIEPMPDTEPHAPFMLQPLKATIPANAVANNPYPLTNQTANALPSGSAQR